MGLHMHVLCCPGQETAGKYTGLSEQMQRPKGKASANVWGGLIPG